MPADAAPLLAGLAPDGVHHRLLNVELKGIAELVGLALVAALAAEACRLHGVVAEAIALEAGEEVAEGLLTNPAHPPGGGLEASLVALDQPRLLESLGDALQLVEAAGRVLAERLTELIASPLIQLTAAVGLAESAFQLLERLEAPHQVHRLVEGQLLAAEEGVAIAQSLPRREQLQGAGQLSQLALQLAVLEDRVHHLHQLAAHLRRERLHQRVHPRHLPLQLVEELVEGVGGVREQLSPAALEGVVVLLQL